MGRPKQLPKIGEIFGDLVCLVPDTGRKRGTAVLGEYKCKCGKVVERPNSAVRGGYTRSCGCFKATHATSNPKARRPPRHGKNESREYHVWEAMKARCLNPKHPAYRHYGGRGIQVCEQWLEFEGFYGDMGDAPEGFTLERRDVDGGYCKENCTWVSKADQMRNTRRIMWVEVGGERMSFTEACRRYTTLSHSTAYYRYKRTGDAMYALGLSHL